MALSVIGVIVLALLLVKGPWWFDGQHLEQLGRDDAPKAVMVTGFRTAMVTFGLAFVAVIGSYLTWKNLQETRNALEQTRQRDAQQHALSEQNLAQTKQADREQQELAREGHITERYVKAVGLLAAASSQVSQLGGIYALERIMKDSRTDALTIVQLLAGYIRENSKARPEPGSEGVSPPVAETIQAAFTVLARRPQAFSGMDTALGLSFRGANLAEVSLKGSDVGALFRADFTGARMVRADFHGAALMRADFTEADLQGANLAQCSLTDALFDRANLRGAKLEHANLGSASLRSAQLQGAWLKGTNLTDADLHDARLYDADGTSVTVVTPEQLLQAHVTSTTTLPSHLENAAGMQEHIAQCTAEYLAGVPHGQPLPAP